MTAISRYFPFFSSPKIKGDSQEKSSHSAYFSRRNAVSPAPTQRTSNESKGRPSLSKSLWNRNASLTSIDSTSHTGSSIHNFSSIFSATSYASSYTSQRPEWRESTHVIPYHPPIHHNPSDSTVDSIHPFHSTDKEPGVISKSSPLKVPSTDNPPTWRRRRFSLRVITADIQQLAGHLSPKSNKHRTPQGQPRDFWEGSAPISEFEQMKSAGSKAPDSGYGSITSPRFPESIHSGSSLNTQLDTIHENEKKQKDIRFSAIDPDINLYIDFDEQESLFESAIDPYITSYIDPDEQEFLFDRKDQKQGQAISHPSTSNTVLPQSPVNISVESLIDTYNTLPKRAVALQNLPPRIDSLGANTHNKRAVEVKAHHKPEQTMDTSDNTKNMPYADDDFYADFLSSPSAEELSEKHFDEIFQEIESLQAILKESQTFTKDFAANIQQNGIKISQSLASQPLYPTHEFKQNVSCVIPPRIESLENIKAHDVESIPTIHPNDAEISHLSDISSNAWIDKILNDLNNLESTLSENRRYAQDLTHNINANRRDAQDLGDKINKLNDFNNLESTLSENCRYAQNLTHKLA